MASFAFDIYPAATPNGTRLVRLTPSKAVQLAFRLPEIGFGMNDGQITIHSAHADATAANFAKHNLVKVVAIRDDLTETKIGGFFLEEGDFTALSTDEQGGRLLKFSGPNTIQYLERAILREQGYTTEAIPWPTRRGGIDIDGMWTWGQDADGREPGPIMVRVLEEGRDQPGAPLGHATWDFTRSVDSAGTSWDALGDEWQVPWGTTALDMAILFIRSGEFHFRWTADLLYRAYKADPGVNRSSALFLANKVRFAAGQNIVTEVHRGIDAAQDVSSVLVTGAEYATAFVTGGTSSVPWVRHLSVQEATVAARLTKAGQRELDARSTRVDAAFPLTHIVQDDELNGGYIPFVHYSPGDMVTLHTGTGAHDFNEFTINVAAVRIVHDEAGNWFGMPELGAQTIEFGSRSFEERSNRLLERPNPPLCPPFVGGSSASQFVDWTWSEPTGLSGFGNWQQTVQEYTINGVVQPSFIMDNGFNNDTSSYRTGSGGASIPVSSTGLKYLPCTAGIDISFSADIRYRSSPGNLTNLHVNWYDTTNALISSVTLYNQTNSGYEHVAATLTPPAGAVYWNIGLTGVIDNVSASTGSGTAAQRPLAGTSIYAARCDHTHIYIAERVPSADDDFDAGFQVGTLWLNTADDSLWVSTDHTAGAAVWTQTSLGIHSTDPDAHLKANYNATAAPTVNDDSTEGYGVGSVWVDTTNDNVYVATDVTAGAANWEQVNGGGGSGIPETLIDAKGDLIAGSAADTAARLAVGTNGHVLTADSAQTTGVKWAASPSGFSNPMTTAGDIIKGGASGAAERLGIGTAGQVLTVNAGATAPEWAAAGGGSGLDPFAAEYRFTSGTDVDFSAATASGLTVADATGYLKVLTMTATNQYWEATVAYGTGDFDVAARLIWLGQTAEASGIHSNPIIEFYVGNAARTARPRIEYAAETEGTTGNNVVLAVRNGGGTQLIDPHYGVALPLIFRIKRVGTTLSFYTMTVNAEGGSIWRQYRGSTDSNDITRIGFAAMTVSTESKALIGWVRNL